MNSNRLVQERIANIALGPNDGNNIAIIYLKRNSNESIEMDHYNYIWLVGAFL